MRSIISRLTQWGATLVIQLKREVITSLLYSSRLIDTVGCHPSNTTQREREKEHVFLQAHRVTAVGLPPRTSCFAARPAFSVEKKKKGTKSYLGNLDRRGAMIALLALVPPAHTAGPQALVPDGALAKDGYQPLAAVASGRAQFPPEKDDESCPGHPNIYRKSGACPPVALIGAEDAPCPGHPNISLKSKDCPTTPPAGLTGDALEEEAEQPSSDASNDGESPAGKLPKPDPKDTYNKPEWVAEDLADVFLQGKPSNDLRQAGLLVHGFDGTELDDEHRWMPCKDGFCKGAAQWWSTSLINKEHPATWGANGIVFSPSRTKVLCSHYCDLGSLSSGCKSSAPDGFNGTGKPYPADYLKEMLQRSMYEEEAKGAYNEVLIDMPEFVANLPHSVSAFYYKANSDGFKQVEAAHAYVAFLDAFNLTEGSIPLLKFTMNVSASEMMEDVSMGARALLQKNKYSAWREKWNKNHPYLAEHPDEVPEYLRKQAAHTWNKPGKGRDLLGAGVPVIATSQTAAIAEALKMKAAVDAAEAAESVKMKDLTYRANKEATEALNMHEQYKSAYAALLYADRDPAPTHPNNAFADAATLVQKRDLTNVLPTLPGHSTTLPGKTSAPVSPATLNAEALKALKEREVKLVSANAQITAADDAWAKSRTDNKASADAEYAAKMQEVVSARAATKAETDATGAALAEKTAGIRAMEKMSDDAKQVAAMFTLAKTRADAKTKSDEMAVAANSVIRESRFGTKTSEDAASAAEAEKLVNAKAVAMVVANAKADASASAVRLDREHTKSASDATAAASSILHPDQLGHPQAKRAAFQQKHTFANSKAAALVQNQGVQNQQPPSAAHPQGSYKSAYAALAGSKDHSATYAPSAYDGVKHNPYVQTNHHQMRHRADKEVHEAAMLAASTLTCTSLNKAVTMAWCVNTCDNGLHHCPADVCQCEKKPGFGGETEAATEPAANAEPPALNSR